MKMNYALLIFVFLLFPVLNNSENVTTTTSITKTDWFWPLIAIIIALLFSIPCTLITVIIICHKKSHIMDSDESSIDSNSSLSSSSTSVSRRPRCNHCQHQHSHHAGGLRSPPPPYRTSEEPENLFVSPSLPPPYEYHVIENERNRNSTNQMTTIINVEPAESVITQSSNNPRVDPIFDVSSTLTNPSLQTFQA